MAYLPWIIGVVVSILNGVTLFWLQFRAFRRHRHRSFLLLLVSTTCGFGYLIAAVTLQYLRLLGASDPVWVSFVPTAFYLATSVLGLWGTAVLFQSYRALTEIGPTSLNREGRT